MVKDIVLPEISENVAGGDVVRVLVSAGDTVRKDQPVLELETEKAGFEVPSPEEGVVTEVDVKEGDTVRVGQVIMKVESNRHAPAATGEKPSPTPAHQPSPVKSSRPSPGGLGGVGGQPAAYAPPPASPSVRRLARELGIDIARVAGSGAQGRISSDDVKSFVRQAPREVAMPVETSLHPAAPENAAERREPLNKVRRLTAESTAAAWRDVPQVTHFDKADITALEAFRAAYHTSVANGTAKLTITSFLTRIAGLALRAFPKLNAGIDMERGEIIYRNRVNIGVAVATDAGLLVPVLTDADTKSVRRIANELAELAAKARGRRILPDQLHGGTFTISNLGGIGGTGFSPLVNSPEVAILGVARARRECVPVDGSVGSRLMLPLSLSYDHRCIDGADAARFMSWIVRILENPLLMIVEGDR